MKSFVLLLLVNLLIVVVHAQDVQECAAQASELEDLKTKLAAVEKAKTDLEIKEKGMASEILSLQRQLKENEGSASGQVQAVRSEGEEKLKAAESKLSKTQEKLETAEKELERNKIAISELQRDVGLLRDSKGEAGKANEEVIALRKQLDEERDKAKKAAEKHKGEMDRSKSKYEAEIKRLQATAAAQDKPLLMILMERGSERAEELRDYAQVFYHSKLYPQAMEAKTVLEENFAKAKEMAQPHLDKAYEASAPIRKTMEDELTPLYDLHLRPHVDMVKANLAQAKAFAVKNIPEVADKAQTKFQNFKKLAITNVQKSPQFGEHAETIVVSALWGVAIISFVLMIGPAIRFCFWVIKTILYFSLCCCCCGCCRSRPARPAVPTQTKPAAKSSPAPPKKSPNNNRKKKAI